MRHLEKNFVLSQRSETKLTDQDLVILNQQMTEAVEQEDYEQAAILRDVINKKKEDPSFEPNKKDFMEPNEGGVYVFNEASPKHRAWRGIFIKKEKGYWEGNGTIKDYEARNYKFPDCLTSGPRTGGVLSEEDREDISRMKGVKGGEKVDFLLELRSKRDEIKDIVNLAEEKFNSLWLPYCKKNGLNASEYKEMHSTYSDYYQLDEERNEVLNKIPRDLRDPLDYWQKVYDNSRIILDDLTLALDKLAE